MNVCVRVEFDAAHRLYGYDGMCSNIHGHRYAVEVSVFGLVGNDGIAVDFGYLKKAIREYIDDTFDHRILLWSHDPLVKGLCEHGLKMTLFLCNPTAEVLATDIYAKLKESFNVHKVRVWETPTCYAETA